MKHPTYLMIGGLVAMGFDASGKFLLTVSHSGRAVFSVENWQRVARDTALAYPADGVAIGMDRSGASRSQFSPETRRESGSR